MSKQSCLTKRIDTALAISLIALVLGVLYFAMFINYPIVGCDNLYFLPRLLDTYVFMRENGLSVHWWTPSFAAGSVVYANPQSMQFSLPVILQYLFPPYFAVYVGSAVVALFGTLALSSTLKNFFSLSKIAATGLASGMIVNGFLLNHLIVGHISYHAFPLVAVLLWASTTSGKKTALAPICIFGLAGAYFVYSGGYFVSVVGLFSLPMSLLLIYCLRPDQYFLQKILVRLLMGGVLAFAMASSKLYAMLSLMKQFPRIIEGVSMHNIWQPFLQLQLFPLITIKVINRETESREQFFQQHFGQNYGLWENDLTVNPLIALLALAAIILVAMKIVRNATWWRNPSWKRLFVCLLLITMTYSVLSIASGQGLVFDLLKDHWPLRSMHVYNRLTASLLMPIIILAGWGLSWFSNRKVFYSVYRQNAIGIILGLSATVLGLAYVYEYHEYPQLYCQDFDVTRNTTLHKNVIHSDHSAFYISKVTEANDDAVVLSSMTNLYETYEPLYGYTSELLVESSEVTTGNADNIKKGAYNLHFPPAFVFPHFYDTEPFSRIKVSDGQNFALFTQFKKPDWKLPPAQRAYNLLSFGALTLVLVCLVWCCVNRLFSKNLYDITRS